MTDRVVDSVVTGRINPTVLMHINVWCESPDLWDPEAGRLPVTFSVFDPNALIRRGRICIRVPGENDYLIVHRIDLDPALLGHGSDHELPPAMQWDGIITEGLTDRRGQRITADLSPLSVDIEVWTTENDAPGIPSDTRRGTTSRPMEGYAVDYSPTNIDAIVEGRWDRDWVIPLPPPGHDEDMDKVTMTITTKNVPEDTPVSLSVYRTVNIDDRNGDDLYTDDGIGADNQPGLIDLVVRGNQIVRSSDGSKPEVQFLNYDGHYTLPGNNFYYFTVRFGPFGGEMVASERDFVNAEPDCLHMRFGVFISAPARDLPAARQAGRYLNNLFRGRTKYWRSYLLERAPDNLEEFLQFHGGRAMVLFLGHAAASCHHNGTAAHLLPDGTVNPAYDGHPKYRKQGEWVFKKVPKKNFAPDQDVCPTDVSTRIRGGCGQRDSVSLEMILGRSRRSADAGYQGNKWWFGNMAGHAALDGFQVWVENSPPSDVNGLHAASTMRLPKFCTWNDGCRGMLTSKVGDVYNANGTRFYVGWVYSVGDAVAAGNIKSVFRKWLLGTPSNPAPDEWDLERFKSILIEELVRTRGRRFYNGRFMDAGTRINPNTPPPPAQVEDAMN